MRWLAAVPQVAAAPRAVNSIALLWVFLFTTWLSGRGGDLGVAARWLARSARTARRLRNHGRPLRAMLRGRRAPPRQRRGALALDCAPRVEQRRSALRCKPLSDSVASQRLPLPWLSPQTVTVHDAAQAQSADAVNNRKASWGFKFHSVLHNASQETVYDRACRHVVAGVTSGQNGTIMAYGQTGAGKTFTMIGDTKSYASRGMAPRALSHLFGEMESRPESVFSVRCSYMEIYNGEPQCASSTLSAPSAVLVRGRSWPRPCCGAVLPPLLHSPFLALTPMADRRPHPGPAFRCTALALRPHRRGRRRQGRGASSRGGQDSHRGQRQ